MKNLLILSTFLVSLNLFAHCPMKFEDTNLCADLVWVNGPVLNKTSHFQIHFWEEGDESHTPVSPQFDINIYSWMVMDNGHSHGGPKLTWAEVAEGFFESKDARFFMGRMKGYWQVRIDLIQNGSVFAQESVDVSFN